MIHRPWAALARQATHPGVAPIPTVTVLGLILSTAGILGVVSLGVVERTKEIGIRRAVGAEAWRVRRMIVLEAVWPVGVGLGLGLGISIGVSLILEGLLLGVEPWDPLTFAGAGALLLAVGVAAASVPARPSWWCPRRRPRASSSPPSSGPCRTGSGGASLSTSVPTSLRRRDGGHCFSAPVGAPWR